VALVIGPGFIEGFGPQWVWRIALTLFGGVTYALAARASLLELRPFVGSERELRYRRALRPDIDSLFCGRNLDVRRRCAES